MNRRRFVANLFSLGVLPAINGTLAREALRGQARPQLPPPLKQLGADCGLRVGAAVRKSQLQGLPDFSSFFASNFNLLTPEREMKWSALHPAPDRYDFADADFLVNFAQTNNIAVHGHNLCWYTGNPAWLTSMLRKDNAKRILQDHIRTVMTHFKGTIDSWDVVNEAVGVGFNRPDGLNGGPWMDMLGPEYIDIAFITAAEVDPQPLRILNINNVEHDNPDSVKARQATINLVTRLLKNRVPIQAVALESHVDAWRPIDEAALALFLRTLRDLGVKVLVTEFDVNDSKISGDIAARDRAVADYYRKYISAFYSVAGTPNRMILWSPTDKDNWMNYMHDAPRWQRDDGDKTHRPGIFDENMHPKESFFALASAIRSICRS